MTNTPAYWLCPVANTGQISSIFPLSRVEQFPQNNDNTLLTIKLLIIANASMNYRIIFAKMKLPGAG